MLALGLGQNSALRRLKKLLDAGVLEPVMVRRTNAWGVTRQMQGYRYVRE